MAYAHENLQEWTFNSSTTANDLSATGDDAEILVVNKPITVYQIGYGITTAISSTVAVVVKFDKRVTYGSDTGRGDGDVGTLTIPTTGAAGQYVYSNITPVNADPGDEIVPQVTTAASTSGAGRPVILYRVREENVANLTDMVASST